MIRIARSLLGIPKLQTTKYVSAAICAAVVWSCSGEHVLAQRALGTDVSYWQNEISQTAWNYAFSNNRVFALVRSSRGGTTGLGQTSGTPGGGTQETLSRRYDDPRFIQNMVRANNAGLMTGAYHFARPDILTNTGADEADHFMQMAGIYMRPGYMLPMYDLEAGQAERTQQELAQFSLDFSNRIYDVLKIRPSIYVNGNYMNDLSGANAATRNALAQPSPNTPSMVSPAFPVLVTARYPAGSGNPYTGDIQNGNPKDAGGTLSWFFGPWDDYGNAQPWHIWQYGSGEAVFGPHGDATTDGDVAQGDIEYLRDTLVPAVWWNDSSGDWSTMTNWNSGQPAVAPQVGPGQAAQYTTGPLPVARLPGAAGTGPTSGQYDTVILERPEANITVTVSTGTHNVRKMYMWEALNITGGTLTINYNPNYNNDFDNNPNTNFPNARRSGPISAQFSGPVTLSGGSLNVHTVQLDAAQTLTLSGGTLSFDTINMISDANTRIAITGDVSINPLNNAVAMITRTARTGSVDLSGGMPTITVGNGTSAVDLDVQVPIVNGGFVKTGLGTMQLSGANTFAGDVTVNGGALKMNHSNGFAGSSVISVNNGGTLDMNNISDTIAGLSSSAGHTAGSFLQGSGALAVGAASGTHTYKGKITGTGTFTKNDNSTQILSNSANALGNVFVSDGSLLFNENATTGNVVVAGGTLGGMGGVSGAVTVNSGGRIAPGASIGSLDVGALTLNADSHLDFELGAPSVGDLINVAGHLSLNGGTFNFYDTGDLGAGNYLLIEYGSLSGSIENMNAVGPENFGFRLIDTGSAITLSVRLVPEPTAVLLLAVAAGLLGLTYRRQRQPVFEMVPVRNRVSTAGGWD